LEISGAVDNDIAGKALFGREARPLSSIRDRDCGCIVVTSYLRRALVYREFPCNKAEKKDIKVAFKMLLVELLGS